MIEKDKELTADPDIIVAIIEGLLHSLTLTKPSMLEYIADYATALRERTKKDDI